MESQIKYHNIMMNEYEYSDTYLSDSFYNFYDEVLSKSIEKVLDVSKDKYRNLKIN